MTRWHANFDHGSQKASVGDGKPPSRCTTITPGDDSCRPANFTTPVRILSTIMSTIRRVRKTNAGPRCNLFALIITAIETTCPPREIASQKLPTKELERLLRLCWVSREKCLIIPQNAAHPCPECPLSGKTNRPTGDTVPFVARSAPDEQR